MTACNSNSDSQELNGGENVIGPAVAPVVDTITPSEGPVTGNTLVKITGTGFDSKTRVIVGNFLLKAGTEVSFVKVLSSTELITIMPSYFVTKADVGVYNEGYPTAVKWGQYNYKPLAADPVYPTPVMQAGDSLGFFTPEANHFTLLPANTPSSADIKFQTGFTRTAFQSPSAIAGRFDGQAGDTVGYYDSRKNEFSLKLSNNESEAELKFIVDAPMGCVALAGDFNGDGIDTIGLYNALTGEFRLKNSNSAGPWDQIFVFGPTDGTAVPLVGDFNGDGIDTIGVFSPLSSLVQLKNSNSAGAPDISYSFGHLNTWAFVGDWNNDGIDTVTLYDRLSNQILFDNSNTGVVEKVLPLPRRNVSIVPLAGHWRPGTSSTYKGYNWATSLPETQGMSTSKLVTAYSRANQFHFIKSLLVIRNGKLVSEAYFNGASPEIAFGVKSVSKSILSALWGFANQEGILPNMQASIADYLPSDYFPPGSEEKKKITLAHLLTMSGGLKWSEGDATASGIWMDVVKSDDWSKTVLAQELSTTAPLGKWNYSTGLTMVAAQVLQNEIPKHLPNDNMVSFAKSRLFDPLGIQIRRWDQSPAGIMVGGAEMFLTSRDMARFGQFYLEKGRVNGVPKLSEAWINATLSPIFDTGVGGPGNRYYGGWWWYENMRGHVVHFALGYGGQVVAVIPTLNMVIVTTSKHDVTSTIEGYQDGLITDLIENYILPAVNF
jgi:CubicO group peptidase (beta-lactamase class C family)